MMNDGGINRTSEEHYRQSAGDEHPTRPNLNDTNQLSDDLLEGADAIAEFVFGRAAMRRKVYHLAQDKKFPVFKLGSKICARKSTLLQWIEAQERPHSPSE